MISRVFFCILFVICVLSGCQPLHGPESVETARMLRAAGLDLPATFSGQVNCFDCRGIESTLTLRPDGLYQLRRSYLEEAGISKTESMMSDWRYRPQEKVIILALDNDSEQTYKVIDHDTIQLIGTDDVLPGPEIVGELYRIATVEQFDDRVHMRGMFSLKEGGATIVECSSGKAFPVSHYGVYEETVRRYAAIPHGYGAPVLLDFEGVLGRVNYTGEQAEENFTITGFGQFYPDSDCEGHIVRASLTETLWVLQQINGWIVDDSSAKKRPYILLEQNSSMVGFGGCCDIAGTFRVNEDMLQIHRPSFPRYACFTGMDLENAFLDVLRDCVSFEIEAETLKLRDKDDTVRAVFQAGLK